MMANRVIGVSDETLLNIYHWDRLAPDTELPAPDPEAGFKGSCLHCSAPVLTTHQRRKYNQGYLHQICYEQVKQGEKLGKIDDNNSAQLEVPYD